MGHEGMRYILPAREMIANDVEAMVQASVTALYYWEAVTKLFREC